jgi:threonine/homoserine/homoserine lactone efflux protein
MTGAWVDVASGMGLGLAVAAPIGPTAMLCIRNTLAGGRLQGLATGCGAATTHMGYALAATLGLAVVLSQAGGMRGALQLGCAAFLFWMAVTTMRRRPGVPEPPGRGGRLWPAYLTGLTWTLGNPVTILGFAALTPSIVHDGAGARSPHLVALGVLLGSVCWWAVLTGAVGVARTRLDAARLRQANLAMGVVLAGLAVLTAVRAFPS